MDMWNNTLVNNFTNVTNSTNGEENLKPIEFICTLLCVIILIFIIVLANLSVISSVALLKHMQTAQNIFLCSLSISDILLAVFILPLNLTRELIGYWPFGRSICQLALSCDIVLCTASIWNICLIGINRYWAVTRGIAYRTENTVKRALSMVTLAWIWSVLISLPPFFFSKSISTDDVDTLICSHSSETWYILFSVSGSFYVPLTIMLFTYYRINVILNIRARQTQFLDLALIRQRRLHITTGLILAAFVVFWFPFFQTYVTLALCTDCGNHDILMKFLEWFAYCNSAVNPFIYNINNTELKTGLHLLYKKVASCIVRANGNEVITLVSPEILVNEDCLPRIESRVIAHAIRAIRENTNGNNSSKSDALPLAATNATYTNSTLSKISEEGTCDPKPNEFNEDEIRTK